jgi:glycosyltransferase involved in cell wall biosynthesis
LQGHVDLAGVRSQAEVAKLLGAAHVAAIASWHEAQCLAVVEALACGVPIVSTPVGIVRELLSDRMVGMCVASRSPDMLADGLEKQLRSEPLQGDSFRRMRQAAVAHLALPTVAHRFVRTYERLAAGN